LNSAFINIPSVRNVNVQYHEAFAELTK
jgi:hypothetical protein